MLRSTPESRLQLRAAITEGQGKLASRKRVIPRRPRDLTSKVIRASPQHDPN
jgi:hypothetical protein